MRTREISWGKLIIMDEQANKVLSQEALRMHAKGRPGKLEVHATKPLTTQRDLTLAYSPGVAAPCLEIHREPILLTTTRLWATWSLLFRTAQPFWA